MANFCLVKPLADLFKQKLKSGEIDPQKLADMSSEERHKFFADFLGEDNAKQVNSLFESKMLLKNQKAGMITWAKKVAGLTPEVRRDLISRIEKLDRVLNPKEQEQFLHDLASTKLGIDVTQQEAKTISDLSKKIQDNSTPLADGSRSPEYGKAVVELRNYLGELKANANKLGVEDFKNRPVEAVKRTAFGVGNLTKGLTFAFDTASLFHQGGFSFLTNPGIWLKSGREAFVKAFQQLGTSSHVMDHVDAQIISRANYDKYVAMKLDIGTTEDPLPSSLPEKIPLYGRAYKATEVAFTGFLHNLRANLADNELKIAQDHGIDITDKRQLQSLGKMINSSTGRGNLGKFEQAGSEINALFASVRLLKGQADTLTAHIFDKDVTGYVKKRAGERLVKAVVAEAGILAISSMLMPGSVEWNPQSSDFGKIKIGNQRFNTPLSGQASLVTLAARLLTMTSKSSTTGKYTKLNDATYGAQTGMDVLNSFFENRFSPVAALLRDYMKGKDPSGNKFDLTTEVRNMILPIGVTSNIQLNQDTTANKILGFLGNEVGLYSTSYPSAKASNWNDSQNAELNQFKSKVGQTTFDNANVKFNKDLQAATDRLINSSTYKNLSDSEKQKAITDLKTKIQSEVFKSYGFKYKAAKQSKTIKDLINEASQ